MYYFIPAWYGTDRPWHFDLIPWYRTFFKLEFDDTFNQIRLLQDQGFRSQLLILSYQPHLRYFLHRHSVLETEAYSVFDDMQDFSVEHSQILSLKDIEWDSECEFIYSPFAILVQRKGRPYAQVEHGVEGFISHIQYFNSEGQRSEQFIMDDRGLVSSVIYFKDDVAYYQDYLNTKGIWQFREHLQDGGRIEINPIFGYRFKSLTYHNIGEVIEEFFEKRLSKIYKKNHLFIIPAHQVHNDLMMRTLPEESHKILSLFIDRNPQDTFPTLLPVFNKVDFTLVDREDSLHILKELYPENEQYFKHLSPFDTRLRLGRSQTRKTSFIYYQLNFKDGIDEEGIYQILDFVSKTKDVELIFGTFATDEELLEQFEDLIQKIIQERIDSQSLEKDAGYGDSENPLEDNKVEELRYQVVNMNDELDLIKTLEFVRLIVDLSKLPHLYTQIAGISAGIPQINRVKTVYVDHLKNGYLISDLSELQKAIHYYLDTLKEWNQALIYSVEKIKEYTGQMFLEKLQNWIGEITDVKES